MDRNSRKIHTLDDRTVASRPGSISVSMVRYALRFPKWPLILALLLVAPMALIVGGGLSAGGLIVAGVIFLIASAANLIYWRRIREHFDHGDANPGIVVSVKPLLVATLTDLAKGYGRYPAIKIVREPRSGFSRALHVGYRVATVALYRGDLNTGRPYWDDFYPYVVEPVAADPSQAERLLDSFDVREWRELEAGLRKLEAMREGLHRIEVQTSDWKNVG